MQNEETITYISQKLAEEARSITESDFQNIKKNYKMVGENSLINVKSNVGLNDFRMYYAIVSQIVMSANDVYWYAVKKDQIGYICNMDPSELTNKMLGNLRDSIFQKTIALDNGAKHYLFSGATTDNSNWYFRLNPDLKPFFIKQRGSFTEQTLKNCMTYKTVLGLRLNEYFTVEYNRQTDGMSFDAKLNYQMCFEYDLEEIKKLSNKRGSYSRYNNFKAQIVKPAMLDMEKDWKIRVSEIKDNANRVKKLRFMVKKGSNK